MNEAEQPDDFPEPQLFADMLTKTVSASEANISVVNHTESVLNELEEHL